MQTLAGDLRGVFPGPITASIFAGAGAPVAGGLAVCDHPFHLRNERLTIWFQKPALAGEFHAADGVANGNAF